MFEIETPEHRDDIREYFIKIFDSINAETTTLLDTNILYFSGRYFLGHMLEIIPNTGTELTDVIRETVDANHEFQKAILEVPNFYITQKVLNEYHNNIVMFKKRKKTISNRLKKIENRKNDNSESGLVEFLLDSGGTLPSLEYITKKHAETYRLLSPKVLQQKIDPRLLALITYITQKFDLKVKYPEDEIEKKYIRPYNDTDEDLVVRTFCHALETKETTRLISEDIDVSKIFNTMALLMFDRRSPFYSHQITKETNYNKIILNRININKQNSLVFNANPHHLHATVFKDTSQYELFKELHNAYDIFFQGDTIKIDTFAHDIRH